ncbi:MAG: hypothetical protein ACFFCS_09595 [Candidatus Hodarchaeota archaeon]
MKETDGKKDKNRIILAIIIMLSVLGGTMLFFAAPKFGLEAFKNNWIIFLTFTTPAVLLILWVSKRRKACIPVVIACGVTGFITEFWGCGLGLWSWVDMKTLFMVNDGIIGVGGFPIEMPIIYSYVGVWINQMSNELFSDAGESFRSKGRYQIFSNKKWNMVIIVTFIVSASIIIAGPLWVQSLVFLSTGILLMSFIPSGSRSRNHLIILLVGILTGVAGFFFENFATGGIIPEICIWKYDLPRWSEGLIGVPIVFAAPICGFVAYFGCGLIFSAAWFIGLKTFYVNQELKTS